MKKNGLQLLAPELMCSLRASDHTCGIISVDCTRCQFNNWQSPDEAHTQMTSSGCGMSELLEAFELGVQTRLISMQLFCCLQDDMIPKRHDPQHASTGSCGVYSQCPNFSSSGAGQGVCAFSFQCHGHGAVILVNPT